MHKEEVGTIPLYHIHLQYENPFVKLKRKREWDGFENCYHMFLHALLYDLEFTIKILNLTKIKCATIHPHLAY